MEASDNGGIGNNAPLRISPTVRRTFETYYYKAMESLGVGTMPLFLAPAKDLKLQSLPETSNENISQNAVAGEIMKDETRQAMTLGITSALPEWLALRGLTVGDDGDTFVLTKYESLRRTMA